MNLSEKLENNKYLLWALLFALFNMGAIFFIFGPKNYGDTQGYVEIIHWFRGEGAQVDPWRVIRPLGPLLALPFEFLGEGAGLIIQNIIFYLLCAFLIFKITEVIYQNKRQAFFASIFFVTATPVIEVGLAYLIDTGAWFFYLFSIFFTLVYLRTKNEKLIPLNGFLSGIGVLMKENGGLGILFFGLTILLSRDFGIKEKLFKIARFGIFFLIPVAILQILMFKYYYFTYWDWYLVGRTGSEGEGLFLNLLRYLGQLFRVLGILWPFFIIGLWREFKEKNWEKLKVIIALIPSSFSFLLWTTAAGGRSVFIFAPLGILLAARGLNIVESKLNKKIGFLTITLLIITLLLLNYYFVWINPKISFVDKLAEFLGLL